MSDAIVVTRESDSGLVLVVGVFVVCVALAILSRSSTPNGTPSGTPDGTPNGTPSGTPTPHGTPSGTHGTEAPTPAPTVAQSALTGAPLRTTEAPTDTTPVVPEPVRTTAFVPAQTTRTDPDVVPAPTVATPTVLVPAPTVATPTVMVPAPTVATPTVASVPAPTVATTTILVPASTTRAPDPPARMENVLIVSGTPHAPTDTALYPQVDSSGDLWWASQTVAGEYLAVVPRKLVPGFGTSPGSSLLLLTNGASAELATSRSRELLTIGSRAIVAGITLQVQGTSEVRVQNYPQIKSESSGSSLTVTFQGSSLTLLPFKADSDAYWWKGPAPAPSGYTEIAVVPRQGGWNLVGIRNTGTVCISTGTTSLGQWPHLALWTASTVAPFTGVPVVKYAAYISPVVAKNLPGACVQQQNTPAAQPKKGAYSVTTTIPILKCTGNLVPYSQGNVTRWLATAALPTLASDSADSEIHVVDLRAEGIVLDAVPRSATWLICSVQGATHRGLAYSTELTEEPPTPGAWHSTWNMASEVVTRQIPSAALSIAIEYRVNPVNRQLVSGTVTWNPVRFPQMLASQLELPFFISQTFGDEPDETLATGSGVSGAYVPEFFRAGVRWKYAGGTGNGKVYPDVYLQRLQIEDIPLARQAPAGSTWVVYKHESTSRGVDWVAVIAYTLSDSTGDSELPASTEWYASQTRKLQFSPVRSSAVTSIRLASA
jgi:hypothetical protein